MKMDPVKKASKFLSKILRHDPDLIGIQLDDQGWGIIEEILAKVPWLARELLDRAVAENDKKRFVVSEDGKSIRACQGHSIQVNLTLEEKIPPEFLYHGTYIEALPLIQHEGLSKMRRHHVHLSMDCGTAVSVGRRSGAPVLLQVRAKQMHDRGHKFFVSENGVWLTDHVPPEFLTAVRR